MKNIFTLLTLFSFTSIFAIDRFVNPNLSSGNGTTLFTTITSAVNAAVNGDRIIVASNTYNEASLTIGKSLQVMPQTPGTIINFNANITIQGFPGMKLTIMGFNLGIYSFSSSAISNGSYTNRAKVSIIDSSSSYIDVNNEYYEANLINNNVTKGIAFRFGNVIKNTTASIVLLDENQDNLNTNSKNFISNNNVSFLIGVYNNDYPFIISNNTLRDISIRRWNALLTLKNRIINNQFNNDSTVHFSNTGVPGYNIVFSNNKFVNGFSTASYGGCGADYQFSYSTIPNNIFNYNDWMPAWPWCCNGPFGWYSINGNDNPTRPNSSGCYGWTSNGSNNYPNINISGFFEWSYNGIDFNCNMPTSGSPLTVTRIIGPTNEIDGGNPNHDYYDIDLTINDRGINGGPYSQLNYNAANPNNSKAYIFDLEMPTDLFPGQNVNIKAKGYHKN